LQYDVKNRRTFLKKTPFPSVRPCDLYLGATVTIYGRQLKVTAFGDQLTARALSQARQRTFGMLKPHAVRHLGDILGRCHARGLAVERLRSARLSQRDAAELYAEHAGRPFFGALVAAVTAGPVVGLELVGPDAVACWREMLGPTRAEEARRDAPGSIRAAYAADDTRNAAHGADSERAAARELEFFFGGGKGKPQAAAEDGADGGAGRHHSTASFENCTLCLIKPHAVLDGHAGPIIDAIARAGFEVSAVELFHLDRASAEEFYEVYKGVVPEFPGMVDQLTAGPCIAVEVLGEDVVPTFRTLCGPPDPEIARHIRPDTLRARFGTDKVANAVHCTDLPEDGGLEVDFFFTILREA
jgi:nucleoside-diphosphate kinase